MPAFCKDRAFPLPGNGGIHRISMTYFVLAFCRFLGYTVHCWYFGAERNGFGSAPGSNLGK